MALSASARADDPAQGAAKLPEIAAPPVRDLPPVGDEPHYYRSRPPPRVFSFRIAAASLAVRFPIDGLKGKLVYPLDVSFQYRHSFARGPTSLAATTEIGYSFLGANGHFLTAGFGLLVEQEGGLSIGLAPHALAGTVLGDGSVGARLGIPFEVDHLVGIEPSYTLVTANGHLVHYATLALTLGAPIVDLAHPKRDR